jgi:hypothetical protein
MRIALLARAVVLAAAAVVLLAAGAARAGSETPPQGPPWVREFRVAQKDALARGVPIFVYLTKTH